VSEFFPIAKPELTDTEKAYVNDALDSTWISGTGKYITRFESNFSDFCGASHGVSVSNGTVALHLGLTASGVGPGDEVIVPDLTFAATINAVLHTGATPVIVDIEEDSWCIDPKQIENAITPKTKAVIPVHLYGQPCDMDAIMDIAKRHSLVVIEDCAEAIGATYNGRKVGSIGDIGCFSFFGNKIISTGEGGLCTTNSPVLKDKMTVLKSHGMSTKRYWHDVIGYNYRMTNIQAAIGCAQLERIDAFLDARRQYEEMYREVFSDHPHTHFQKSLPDRQKVTWLTSLLDSSGYRDNFLGALKKQGIDSRPFFFPLSAMDIYKPYGNGNPVSQKISLQGYNLPTYGSTLDISKIKATLKNIVLVTT